jgi:hypothetical protein
MLTDLLLSSSPWQPPGRGRRCALWVSPWIDRTTILDTAALTPGDLRHAGPDQFPADCLLLVVSPAEHARLTQLEGDPTAEARARHLADLERETAAQPFGRVLPFRRV